MSGPSSSLSETLRKDQRERWERGERVPVETYVQQFPALAEQPETLLDLVLAEISIRQAAGEAPSAGEYAGRFPSLCDRISQALSSSRQQEGVGSGDTDRTSFGLRTRPIECPYCEAPTPLPDVPDPKNVHCPRCNRRIHVLDETISIRNKAGRTVGSFELIERVGRGQFGEVWLARDNHLRREVAIKLPRRPEDDEEQAELFLHEARASARLRHPNIVPVYEAGSDDSVSYIVTAFVRGATLKQLLKHKKYAPREAAGLCRKVAEALEHAHQAGIVHRDLKPSNILIDEHGEPHVADFGLAKHSGLDEITVTVEGHILGTPAYMSPEQARGQARQAGPGSDIYSLGVVLYQLLTGQRPFEGPLEVLMHRILTEEPTPPRQLNKEIPRDLETICLKAMAKSPAARYATAQAMADDFDCFLRNEPIQARRPSLAERTLRRARRGWPAIALVAAVCVAVLGLILGQADKGNPPDRRSEPELPPLALGQAEPPSPNFKHKVLIQTVPEGADVVCYPIDWETGRPDGLLPIRPLTQTPVEIELSSGTYLVVGKGDSGFHEVVRSVPRVAYNKLGPYPHERWTVENETIVWPEFGLFSDDVETNLEVCDGAEDYEIDLTGLGGAVERWRIPRFKIARTELSVGEFRPLDNFHRQEGRGNNLPAARLSWDEAVHYAELRGLRLPDLLEVEFLATAGGTQLYPWGDKLPPADNWNFNRPLDVETHDRLKTNPQITGLLSRVLEWTTTRTHIGMGSDNRPGLRYVVRGGPPELIPAAVSVGPWASVNQYRADAAVGVRLARSPGPRLKPEDFIVRASEE